MGSIKFETTVDEHVAGVMPKLRPLLGQRIEVVAAKAPAAETRTPRNTLDDFLAHRLKRPADLPPVTLDDMEKAIEKGASGEGF